MQYSFLDKINFPSDLRNLNKKHLKQVSDELRHKTVETVSKTGGHLGAGLGVVELTVALHYVFNTPRDRLIWDVGHQAYPHKIITGRKKNIETCVRSDRLSNTSVVYLGSDEFLLAGEKGFRKHSMSECYNNYSSEEIISQDTYIKLDLG